MTKSRHSHATTAAHLVCAALFFSCPAIASPPVLDAGPLPGDLALAPATNTQYDHTVSRGGDQILVVWSDQIARSSGSQSIQSDGDIFGIRLNADGTPIDAVPFLIAGGRGLQSRPTVAWNGEAWMVLFTSQDPSAGFYEDRLRAVRISAQGAVLDATPITLPPSSFAPNTIGLQLAGLNGQWLITRCVYHNDGYGTYLAGQRIAANGTLLDAAPIMLMDWIYGATKTIVTNGEYLVVGPDWNNSSTIKARRISTAAQPLAPAFTIPSLNIAGNGTEYFVTWVPDFVNLVGSRMTNAGTLLNPAGTLLAPDFGQYNAATLTHDGTQWWLEWGAADILHTVRISAAGTVLDPNGGPLLPISINGTNNNAYKPTLVPAADGVHLFWHDGRADLGSDTNVFMLPITSTNTPGTERCISTGTANQRNPDFASGPSGSSAVVFVSEHANDDRVLVQFLDTAGNPITSEPIEVFRGPTVGKASVAWNGSIFMVTWDSGQSGLTPVAIQARRLNPDGSFIDADPISMMAGFNPDIESLGADFLIAAPRPQVPPNFIFLYSNRIDAATGTPIDGPEGQFLCGGFYNCTPRVRTDGSQWIIAAHSLWSPLSTQGDATLAFVPPAGPITPCFNPTPTAGGTGDPDIAFSGSTSLIVWRNNTLSAADNSIVGRLMNPDGTYPGNAFVIAQAAGRQLRPTVSWDGATFIVAWDDQRNQTAFFDERTDVYATRVSESGVVLDPQAFSVDSGPQRDSSPALLSKPDGTTLVANTRFLTTNGFNAHRIGLSRIGTPCIGDVDHDADTDSDDIVAFFAAWDSGASSADVDGDGDTDSDDIIVFFTSWDAGC